MFINRRIGELPELQAVDPRELRDACPHRRRSTCCGREARLPARLVDLSVKLDLNMASQTVQLSAASQDVGSAQETLPCEIEGEDVEIAFNYAYVLEGLSSVAGDKGLPRGSVFAQARHLPCGRP